MLLDEAPLRAEMWDFGIRILELSLVISLITAALVYLSLHWLLVRPMRRITASMIAVPRGSRGRLAGHRAEPPPRRDRPRRARARGVAGNGAPGAGQRARLAALGTAVTKINHDLRNILSTARLVTDGLAASAAPEVRRVAPRLFDAIDRAVALCTRTLDFSREGAPPLAPSRFPLRPLIDEIGPVWRCSEDDLAIELDVPADLRSRPTATSSTACCSTSRATRSRPARTGCASRPRAVDGAIAIEVADDGPGLPPKARDNLFRPFFGSARPGGTGLGLAIARELARPWRRPRLVASTGAGTTFRLTLPAATRRAGARP